MIIASRRTLLAGLGAGAITSVLPLRARATLARGLSLTSLVRGSRHIAVVTALGGSSHFEELGRRRRIVTDMRVRVEEALAKGEGLQGELLVRTLGGSVGRLGEHVHGQVEWSLGEPCVAFLLEGPDGLHYVNGMAQGHYPLRSDGALRLTKSPDLPELLEFESSAVRELVGIELRIARSRITAALAK